MDTQRTLLDSWPGEFARTVEMMTGSSVQVTAGVGPPDATLWWENRLTTSPPARLSVGASRAAWSGIGSAVLQAAGVESSDENEARSTWLELVEQAASAVAGATSTPAQRVESAAGSEASAPEGNRHTLQVSLDGRSFEIELVVHCEEQAPAKGRQPGTAMAVAAGAGGGGSAIAQDPTPTAPAVIPQRTIDALLDVHLPVSISFGHARMPLKDVLKLTAGTVVELNRQPEDPVDIIVNDCVVARGEVVVVDGNYAVRIQSIVGRRERLGAGASRESSRFTS